MGSLCSKTSNESDPLSRPGQVLGTNATANSNPNPRAPLPQKVDASRPPTKGPGKTLGSSSAAGKGNLEARNAAALAAEERAAKHAAASNKGKLSSQLASQKAQTRNEMLAEASKHERATRQADAAAATQRYD